MTDNAELSGEHPVVREMMSHGVFPPTPPPSWARTYELVRAHAAAGVTGCYAWHPPPILAFRAFEVLDAHVCIEYLGHAGRHRCGECGRRWHRWPRRSSDLLALWTLLVAVGAAAVVTACNTRGWARAGAVALYVAAGAVDVDGIRRLQRADRAAQ